MVTCHAWSPEYIHGAIFLLVYTQHDWLMFINFILPKIDCIVCATNTGFEIKCTKDFVVLKTRRICCRELFVIWEIR